MAPSRASTSTCLLSCRAYRPPRHVQTSSLAHRPSTHLSTTPTRHVATSRRTTKLLRPTPAPSATPGSKFQQPIVPQIVFNPPPSAPSPFQTPLLFLPPSDPRRTTLARSYAYNNPYASDSRPLPPPVRETREKTYPLNAEQIQELRQLRSSDPFTWTKKKLAEKFGCTEFFVSMCSPAPQERLDWARRNEELVRAEWGKKRREAREERAKRRVLWERDQ